MVGKNKKYLIVWVLHNITYCQLTKNNYLPGYWQAKCCSS